MKAIPRSEFTFTFSRSGGAGGQNVNKVNSKVTLQWDIFASQSCDQGIKERFISTYPRFIVGNYVVITSQKHRSQHMNIEDCVMKLNDLLSSVKFPPKDRRATKPTKSSVIKRLEGKKIKSFTKKMRSEKF